MKKRLYNIVFMCLFMFLSHVSSVSAATPAYFYEGTQVYVPVGGSMAVHSSGFDLGLSNTFTCTLNGSVDPCDGTTSIAVDIGADGSDLILTILGKAPGITVITVTDSESERQGIIAVDVNYLTALQYNLIMGLMGLVCVSMIGYTILHNS